MTNEADQGGEAPCFAHIIDELDSPEPRPSVLSTNTIIYCESWSDVVDFYRDGLGLQATMERDWFVEFQLHPGAHISVADASRATIGAGTGAGLTLSWRVGDIDATRRGLVAHGVEVSATTTRWGADCIYVFDPAGNRVEFWA